MKKAIFIFCLLVAFGCKAQTILTNKIPEYRFENKLSVGIQNSTANPTDVWFQVGDSATSKAMFIPRVQTTSAITTPRQGMVVYSISDSSFYYRSLYGWRKGITTSSVINDLADVNITSPSSGHVLTYVTNEWVNQAPTTYTASEGLHMNNSTDVRLGGTLTADTVITLGANTLTFTANTLAGDPAISITSTSTAAASNLQKGLNVSLSGANANATQETYGVYSNNSHTGGGNNYGVYGTASGGANNYGIYGVVASNGSAIYGSSTSGFGLSATSSSGVGVYGSSSSSYGVSAASISTYALKTRSDAASTNSVQGMILLERASSGTPANGIGASIDFSINTVTSGATANEIISKWTDATHTTRTSQLIFAGVNNASTNDLMRLGDRVTLTESSATTFASTTVATGKIAGGEIIIVVTADDATDYQERTLRFIWSAVNKAGALTITIGTPEETVAASTGTLTATITGVDAGSGVLNFQANAVSSLTQTTLRCSYTFIQNF